MRVTLRGMAYIGHVMITYCASNTLNACRHPSLSIIWPRTVLIALVCRARLDGLTAVDKTRALGPVWPRDGGHIVPFCVPPLGLPVLARARPPTRHAIVPFTPSRSPRIYRGPRSPNDADESPGAARRVARAPVPSLPHSADAPRRTEASHGPRPRVAT